MSDHPRPCYALALIASLAIHGGCGSAGDNAASTPSPAATTPSPPNKFATGTQDFRSEAGNYSIRMPGTPKSTEQSQDTPDGKITIHTDMVVDKDGTTRGVTYTDLPASKVPKTEADALQLLDDGIRGMGAKTNWSFDQIWNRNDLDGHTAKDVAFQIPAEPGKTNRAAGHVRAILVGNRVYQLLMIQPGVGNPAVLKGFVNSFKLLAPVTK